MKSIKHNRAHTRVSVV